jgi:hypothetical protein
VPFGDARAALAADDVYMLVDAVKASEAVRFDQLMQACGVLGVCANRGAVLSS